MGNPREACLPPNEREHGSSHGAVTVSYRLFLSLLALENDFIFPSEVHTARGVDLVKQPDERERRTLSL